MDPMSCCNIRLVFTLPPRDSTKDAHASEILSLRYNLELRHISELRTAGSNLNHRFKVKELRTEDLNW